MSRDLCSLTSEGQGHVTCAHAACLLLSLTGFAWATDLSTDLESQLSVSCKCYEAANEILQFSDLKSQNPEHYVQVLKRMGNIRNEIGVFYMNQAAALQSERLGECAVGFFP